VRRGGAGGRGGEGCRGRGRLERARGRSLRAPAEPPPEGRARGDTVTVTASPGGSIIYLEDVTVEYDGFKALNGLNFFMDYKELRVVIGPNGAGKTTLLDVISGKAQPTVGRVIFGRHTDLVGRRENEIASL